MLNKNYLAIEYMKDHIIEFRNFAEVMGWNPVQARIFFQALILQLLKLCV